MIKENKTELMLSSLPGRIRMFAEELLRERYKKLNSLESYTSAIAAIDICLETLKMPINREEIEELINEWERD